MNRPPILYVEDEENDVFFMKRAFLKTGLSNPLQVARNGKEAFSNLQRAVDLGEVPCLVILDINMPIISGFEVLSWMRQSPHFHQTPVCVLSSSDQLRDVQRAKELGADEFEVKPISPLHLERFWKRLMERWPLAS